MIRVIIKKSAFSLELNNNYKPRFLMLPVINRVLFAYFVI